MAARRSARPGPVTGSQGSGPDRAHHREQKRGAELSSPAIAQSRKDRAISRREQEPVRLRPSRIAREEGGHRARALRRLSGAATGRTRGGRTTARSSRSALPSPLLQRSLVKVSYAPNRRSRSWRAHGHYLSRKGAQRENERGQAFDAERDDIALPARLDSWQQAGDPRLWKIVVSPEAGGRIDLRRHAREVVARIEHDLGTKLEWAAIDHYDTDHPHVHIAVRGVDDRGHPLSIPREYVRSGIRLRSQELLTLELGYRHERDRHVARERSVLAPRLTDIDRSLLARANESREISLEGPTPSSRRRQEQRLQDRRRLHFLAGLGLAENVGPRRWRLSTELEAGLRQIQISGDIQKSLARSSAPIADHTTRVQLTRLEAGAEILGRVAGSGLDESRDEPFLILEGTDGVRHVVPQTPEIQRAREAGTLRPGTVVTLRATTATGRLQTRISQHGRLGTLKRTSTASTILDLDALHVLRETGRPPEPLTGRRSFLRQWREALIARIPILEREGLVRIRDAREGKRTHEVTEGAEQVVEARMADRGREPRSFQQLERAHGKPIHHARLEPSRRYRGEVVAYSESEGQRYVVLDTGRELTAVPTDRADLHVGQRVLARAQLAAEDASRERRRLTWTLDDLEHQHEHHRGR